MYTTKWNNIVFSCVLKRNIVIGDINYVHTALAAVTHVAEGLA